MIKLFFRQLFCRHREKELREHNPKEGYTEHGCLSCGKIIFKDLNKPKSLFPC